MTLNAPIRTILPTLAFVTLLASSAFPQSPPKYDPATETHSKGIVEELKLVPPTGGKPEAYLVMKASGSDAPQIYLCPKRFLDQMEVDFKAGEEIEITGSKVKQGGVDLTLAREILKKDGNTMTLRFKDGKPAW